MQPQCPPGRYYQKKNLPQIWAPQLCSMAHGFQLFKLGTNLTAVTTRERSLIGVDPFVAYQASTRCKFLRTERTRKPAFLDSFMHAHVVFQRFLVLDLGPASFARAVGIRILQVISLQMVVHTG